MQDAGYNGWKNYATWGVALILDNDEGTYNEVNEMVETLRENEPDALKYRLADQIKDYTEMLCGLGDNDYELPEPSQMAQQLLSAALSDVDWDEIADHYVES
jgi:hypothetical protein